MNHHHREAEPLSFVLRTSSSSLMVPFLDRLILLLNERIGFVSMTMFAPSSSPPSLRTCWKKSMICPLLRLYGMLRNLAIDRSRVRSLDIRMELAHLRLVNCEGMDDYLRKIKTLADQLRDVTAPLSPEYLVAYAFMGLTPQYESFITSIANGRDLITFEQLCTKHSHQESRLQQNFKEATQSTAAALKATIVALQAAPVQTNGRGNGPGSRGGHGDQKLNG
ncbi:hypothetical protein CDL15_Pgr009293 [Punica granatum]|nr:hypothetical protein CDL15_Pgr009293 [Punica granatum]